MFGWIRSCWRKAVSFFNAKSTLPVGVAKDVSAIPSLKEDAPGVKAFQKYFLLKHKSFSRHLSDMSHGRSPQPNFKADWIGGALLSSSFVLLNGVVAGLAICGLLCGFLSLGVSVGVSLIGCLSGVAFNFYRSRQKSKHIRAMHTFNQHQIEKNIHDLMRQVMIHFSEQLNGCSEKQAKRFARKVHHVMSNAIINGRISSPCMLLTPMYMKMYAEKWRSIEKNSTAKMLAAIENDKQISSPTQECQNQHESVTVSSISFNYPSDISGMIAASTPCLTSPHLESGVEVNICAI